MCSNCSCRKKKKTFEFKNEMLSSIQTTGLLHFASLFFLFFSLSFPVSQRVSTAESAPAWMKMSPHALCHTWILYSSRREKEVVLPAALTPSLSYFNKERGFLQGPLTFLFFYFFYATPNKLELKEIIYLTPTKLSYYFGTFCFMICLHHWSWICLTCGRGGELFKNLSLLFSHFKLNRSNTQGLEYSFILY